MMRTYESNRRQLRKKRSLEEIVTFYRKKSNTKEQQQNKLSPEKLEELKIKLDIVKRREKKIKIIVLAALVIIFGLFFCFLFFKQLQ